MFEKVLSHIFSLNQWRKKHLSQNTFLIIAAAITGAVGGLAAALLKTATHWVAHMVNQDSNGIYRYYLLLVLPIIGLFLTVLYIRVFIRKHTFRKGIPPVIRSITKNRSRLDFHNIYSQIITSALTVGMGGSAGLESPAVNSGASAGSNLARLFGLNYRERTLLLACGGAAGIAGAFDSPIAGMLFSLEVLLPAFSIPAITPLLISSAVGSVISRFVYNKPLFVFVTDSWAKEGFWIYVVFGILAGFYTVFYAFINEKIYKSFEKIKNAYVKVAIGGIILGVLIMFFPALYGEGYVDIQRLLDGHYTSLLGNSFFSEFKEITWAIVLFAVFSLIGKTMASAVTMGSGGNGGMFGPSVVIGGLMGFVFAFSLNSLGWTHLNITHFIVVGMAASVSGVMHAPLTGVFLSAEITGSYVLMVPLMVVSGLAYFINKNIRVYSIYTKNLAETGELVSEKSKDRMVLEQLKIKYLLKKDLLVLKSDLTPKFMKDDIISSSQSIFPVVDENGVFLGILHIEELLEIIYNPEDDSKNSIFKDLVQPNHEVVKIDSSMEEVLQTMENKNLLILPVTDNQGVYLGVISKNSIFTLYRKFLKHQRNLSV